MKGLEKTEAYYKDGFNAELYKKYLEVKEVDNNTFYKQPTKSKYSAFQIVSMIVLVCIILGFIFIMLEVFPLAEIFFCAAVVFLILLPMCSRTN